MSPARVFFEKHEKQLKIPFIIYVHFDSIRVPQGQNIVHQPCGFGVSVKCSYDDALSTYEWYQGEDSPRVLWQKLEEKSQEIATKLKIKATPQVLNDEEKNIFGKVSSCYFCGKKLGEDRYQDFDFLTGQFLGAAHKQCAYKSKVQQFVPVVLYNFGKYGYNFLMKVLREDEKKSVFKVGDKQGLIRDFPNSVKLHLIDLRQFMNEKIEDLEAILDDSKKRRLKKEFKEEEFNLMKKKCCFPLAHVDSFRKFEEEDFPKIEGFFDQLHDAKISQEEYERSARIWEVFGCRNIGDYFKIYLKSNVFLLEDIFENFRKLCLDKYGLDPAHYFTIASFSWDSMLKYTGVNLDMLRDKQMISFIKGNIRGGLTQCSKRHAQANKSTCITYLDANNLGGWAMSQKLPFSNFRWLSQREIADLWDKIPSLDEDGDFGYFLEVDLGYPKNLHEKHKDLPFCYERRELPSCYERREHKTMLTLYDKKNYGIEYRTLKQCLQHGLVLKKIHRVIEFKQCKWLESYINYNTNLRAKAKTDFEAKLYKLLNNSIYGKTMQRTSTDKPIYAGFSILELSKKFMYDFHYNHMVCKYPNKINLLYIATDGVIYEIHTSNYFEDIKTDPDFLQMLDTSNLDPDLGIPLINKKVVGKMKHEYGSKVIREFFGPGASVYFLDVDGEEVKKAVGMKKYVKEKHISRADYENCVLFDKRITRKFWVNAANHEKWKRTSKVVENYEVVSRLVQQSVLSPGDWKRSILPDKINTEPWGYNQ